ncbi:MAG: LD-carboxypeptidase [Alphaproteobacteria bacterium]|nr:LD-carboxypeptidase [Alphaproteobacteria bacterium]
MTPKIAIIAPASYFPLNPGDEDRIVHAAYSLGYDVVWGKHIHECAGFLASSDENRAQDIMQAFANTDVEVIMALRGGYGCARLLDKLDWKFIQKHPKIFVGFSDTTVLQNALLYKSKIPSVTGFLAGFWTKRMPLAFKENLRAVLNGESVVLKNLTSVTAGKTQGVIIGGCLSVFVGLLGTPYLPRLKNKILLLEDVQEEPYKIDRMLTHLKNAGVFNAINGVILGDFYQCFSYNDKTAKAVRLVLKEHFGRLKIPVVAGVRYSHGPEKVVLPFGTWAKIDADKGMVCIDGMKKKC